MKTCNACLQPKDEALFRAGRARCDACAAANTRRWRELNPERARAHYVPEVKKAQLKAWRAANPAKLAAQLQARHSRAKQARVCFDKEFDDLVLAEAADLCQRRAGEWTLDHVVPLSHLRASGLHTGHNFAVVPAGWNSSKGNRSMATFFPIHRLQN